MRIGFSLVRTAATTSRVAGQAGAAAQRRRSAPAARRNNYGCRSQTQVLIVPRLGSKRSASRKRAGSPTWMQLRLLSGVQVLVARGDDSKDVEPGITGRCDASSSGKWSIQVAP